jgi:hypothetical protein
LEFDALRIELRPVIEELSAMESRAGNAGMGTCPTRLLDYPAHVIDNGSVTGAGNGTSGEPSEH